MSADEPTTVPRDCFCGSHNTWRPYLHLRRNALRAVRCRACGLVVVVNTPINESNLADSYSLCAFEGDRDFCSKNLYRAYYQECGYEDYDPANMTIKQFDRILDELPCLQPSARSVLDVGCATGVFLERARRRGYAVKGVEVNDERAQYAREHFRVEVVKDLLQAPFSRGEFDVITLLDVIEHLPVALLDPMLCRMAYVLAPEGVVVVRTPAEDALLRVLAKAAYWGSFRCVEIFMPLFYSYEHILNFAPASLRAAMARHGLHSIRERREEENPERLNLHPASRLLLRGLYLVSAVTGRQHKMVHFYGKVRR